MSHKYMLAQVLMSIYPLWSARPSLLSPCYQRFALPLCCWVRVEAHTSLQIPLSSSHISRGNMFFKNGRLTSASTISSSASRGWSGKDAGFVLQFFMAQVRKLRVRSFMLANKGYVKCVRGLMAK
jgi:hypothetical protein